jgi:hypothetical protein
MELLLLGNVATLFDKPLEFDPMACRIVNNDQGRPACSIPRGAKDGTSQVIPEQIPHERPRSVVVEQ